MRRRATPTVAICIRIPIPVEEQLRRMLVHYDESVPKLLVRALAALEAQTARGNRPGRPTL
jgi:hypothetical protein